MPINKYLGGRTKSDFIARISYKTKEEGGRHIPIFSNYFPLIEFPGLHPFTGGKQLFIDKERVYPGETVNAEISIISVEPFYGKLYVGQIFNVCELPGKNIATGEILEIINTDLMRNKGI